MLIRLIILSGFFVLAGCSSKYGSTEVGEYVISDSAPSTPISAAEVQTITAYDEPSTSRGNKSPYKVFGKTYKILDSVEGYRQKGVASWYGTKFHGRKTSNGEIYDMYKLTAAHKSLPIPSYVKVTNLDNNKSVIVRVNDRGPFHGGRLIDLSYGAAVKLDYMNQGTAPVLVEALDRSELSPIQADLQVGAFQSKDSAKSHQKYIKTLTDYDVYIEHEKVYRVKIGPINLAQAQTLKEQLLRDQQIEAVLQRRPVL